MTWLGALAVFAGAFVALLVYAAAAAWWRVR